MTEKKWRVQAGKLCPHGCIRVTRHDGKWMVFSSGVPIVEVPTEGEAWLALVKLCLLRVGDMNPEEEEPT